MYNLAPRAATGSRPTLRSSLAIDPQVAIQIFQSQSPWRINAALVFEIGLLDADKLAYRRA